MSHPLATRKACESVLSLKAGDRIFGPGSGLTSPYLIVSGRVALSLSSAGGDIPLGEAREGDFIGEIHAVGPCSSTYKAEMLTDGRLMAVPIEQINAQLEQSPALIQALFYTLTKTAGRMSAQGSCRRTASRFPAIAHFLHYLSQAVRADGSRSMPYGRTLRLMMLVLGLTHEEAEAELQVFVATNLLRVTRQQSGRPQLEFLAGDGFLGRAMHYHDHMRERAPISADEDGLAAILQG